MPDFKLIWVNYLSCYTASTGEIRIRPLVSKSVKGGFSATINYSFLFNCSLLSLFIFLKVTKEANSE